MPLISGVRPKQMIAFLPFLGLLLATSVNAQQSSVSVCSVFASPTEFHGKKVSIRGTILPNPHGIFLADARCPDAHVALGSDETDESRGPNAKFYRAYWANFSADGKLLSVTVNGTFWYHAGQSPFVRLDRYVVTKLVVGPKRRPR